MRDRSGFEPSSGSAQPHVTVVVPAWQAEQTLDECLRALSEQTVVEEGLVQLEVIVVDDGSTDGTADIAEAWALGQKDGAIAAKVLRRAHFGAASARNAGVEAARGDVLLFTDADCRPAPQWAARLLAALTERGANAAMGRFQSDQRRLVPRLVQAEYARKEAAMLARGTVPFFDTATAAVRATVLREVGGFRESMAAVEDTELAFRLAAAGHSVRMVDGAVVFHQHPKTWRAYARRKFRFGRWGARAYLAHPTRVADDGRTPSDMKLQLVLAPFLPLIGAVVAITRGTHGTWILSVVAGGFVLSTLPAAFGYARAGGGIAASLAWPIAALLRALALGAGLAFGLTEAVLRSGQSPVRRSESKAVDPGPGARSS